METVQITILILFSNNIICNPLSLQIGEENDDANDGILRNIMEEYITDSQTVIIRDGNDYDIPLIFNRQFPKIIIDINEDYSHINSSFGFSMLENVSCIIVVKNKTHLELILLYLRRQIMENYGKKFLVIYRRKMSEEIIEASFSMLFNFYVYRMVILNFKKPVTWHPYSRGNECGLNMNILKYTGTEMVSSALPIVLDGCRFTMLWMYMYPSLPDPYNETNPGSLGYYFRTLFKSMNISVEYLNDTAEAGMDSRNNTFSIRFNYLVSKNISFGIHPFVGNKYADKVIVSWPLVYTGMDILLPPRRKVSSRNEKGLSTIGLVILIDFVITILTLRITVTQTFASSLFVTLRLFLQYQIPAHLRTGRKNHVLLIFGFTLLSLIILNASFNCYLSSVLTRPLYEPRIKTIEQLLKSDIKVKLHRFMLKDIPVSENKRIFAEMEKYTKLLESFVKDKNHALVIDFIDKCFLENPSDADQIPVRSYVTYNIYMRNGFPLIKIFNHWIMRIFESGFQFKWLHDSIVDQPIYVIEKNPEFEEVALRIEHLETAFSVLIIGLIFGILLFSLEIGLHKSKRNSSSDRFSSNENNEFLKGDQLIGSKI